MCQIGKSKDERLEINLSEEKKKVRGDRKGISEYCKISEVSLVDREEEVEADVDVHYNNREIQR